MVFKYAHRGDDGYTDVIGQRISKDSPVIEFIGELDELVSLMGVVKAYLSESKVLDIVDLLDRIQRKLMFIAGYVASMGRMASPIDDNDLASIEKLINDFSNRVVLPSKFVVPGSSLSSALIHFLRAVCRRVERRAVKLLRDGMLDKTTYMYLNRLSDLLYMLGLYINVVSNVKEDLL
ncbi:MAG: cob(I)yrinic acid a,c-diamide adenosyltransferase [Ignisphaera sp.]